MEDLEAGRVTLGGGPQPGACQWLVAGNPIIGVVWTKRLMMNEVLRLDEFMRGIADEMRKAGFTSVAVTGGIVISMAQSVNAEGNQAILDLMAHHKIVKMDVMLPLEE